MASASGAPAAGSRAERTADARAGRANPAARREAAEAYRIGYQRGLAGGEVPDTLGDRQRGPFTRGHSEGLAERRKRGLPDQPAEAPSSSSAKSSSSSTRRSSSPPAARGRGVTYVPREAASLALGMLAWALFINWVQGGTDQAKGWIAAKFLNKPYGGSSGPGKVASEVAPNPAPANVASSNGTGAVLPNPPLGGPGGAHLAIPGLGTGPVT